MALVTMTCPNCGGALQPNSNGEAQFDCPYCHTTVLNIVDAKIDGDIETIDVDSFVRQIKEQRKQFVIHIDKQYKVIDVETAVINEKLQQAEKLLEKRQWGTLQNMLADIPNNIVAAARMKLLARVQCCNEYELTLQAARLDSPEYQNLLSVCDEETAQSYRKLHDICLANLEIEQEIRRVTQFFHKVHMFKEAYAYALNMCAKYPANALSWLMLKDIKQRIDHTYIDRKYEDDIPASCITREERIARTCPDYILFNPDDFDPVPDAILTRSQVSVACAHCGKTFFATSHECVCPHCKHEQSNDVIFESCTRSEKRLEEYKAKYSKNFSSRCTLHRSIMAFFTLLCAAAIVVEWIAMQGHSGRYGHSSITPEQFIRFVYIFHGILLFLIVCIGVHLIVSRRSAAQKRAEYVEIFRGYAVDVWLEKEGRVTVSEYPKLCAKGTVGFIVFALIAVALLVVWTVVVISTQAFTV